MPENSGRTGVPGGPGPQITAVQLGTCEPFGLDGLLGSCYPVCRTVRKPSRYTSRSVPRERVVAEISDRQPSDSI